MKTSQCDAPLEILKRGQVVTPLVAFQVTGSLACHSRIAELRERGYDIVCRIRRDGEKKWGEYSLRQAELEFA